MQAVVKMLSNRPTCTSTVRAEGQAVKREQVESKWTIAEMKDIVRQERVIRLVVTGRTNRTNELNERTGRTNRTNELNERTGRTNRTNELNERTALAAEHALTAAKEAQKMIVQLEEELAEKDQQLQQERAARKRVELASKWATNAVVRASSEDTQHQSSSSADVLKTKNLSSSHSDTTVDIPVSVRTAERKKPRDDTLVQSPVKKLRGPDKAKVKAMQSKPARRNMSLEDARKYAIEETKRRMQERAAALTGTKD